MSSLELSAYEEVRTSFHFDQKHFIGDLNEGTGSKTRHTCKYI